jgi:hypothetical protein
MDDGRRSYASSRPARFSGALASGITEGAVGKSKGALRAASAPVSASAILGALAAVILAASLGSCAKKPPEVPAPVFPYAADSPRVFYASASGLTEARPAASASQAEGAPATRAPNASVLSSDGRTIIAAVNGWGIASIVANAGVDTEAKAGAVAKNDAAARPKASPESPAYRIVGTPLPSIFAGLTAAGAWPVGGGFLLQLFRDPFTEAPSSPSHVDPPYPLPKTRLAYVGRDGAADPLDPFASEAASGFELFALLPSEGKWFAELRKDSPDRADLKFLALGDPPLGLSAGQGDGTEAAARPVEIERTEFEAALMPKSLASLGGVEGDSLRAAIKALGEGPWLVKLRSGTGGDSWYLSAGKAEEAAPVYAWSGPSGTLALRTDGWLASSKAGSGTKLSSLGEAVPGVSFTALASAGELVVAAWETGEFPNIDEAGLVIAPLPR